MRPRCKCAGLQGIAWCGDCGWVNWEQAEMLAESLREDPRLVAAMRLRTDLNPLERNVLRWDFPLVGGPHCKGTGEDEIDVGEVHYGWNGYNECWTGVDGDGRTVYVPDEGPGSLPGCPDPATEPQP
jgi:hypothetical protein